MRANEPNNRPWDGASTSQTHCGCASFLQMPTRHCGLDITPWMTSVDTNNACFRHQFLEASHVPTSSSVHKPWSFSWLSTCGTSVALARSVVAWTGWIPLGVAPVGLNLCHQIRSMRSCIVVCSSIVDRGLCSGHCHCMSLGSSIWLCLCPSTPSHQPPLQTRLCDCQHLCNAFFTERSIVVLVWLYMCFGIVFSFCHTCPCGLFLVSSRTLCTLSATAIFHKSDDFIIDVSFTKFTVFSTAWCFVFRGLWFIGKPLQRCFRFSSVRLDRGGLGAFQSSSSSLQFVFAHCPTRHSHKKAS